MTTLKPYSLTASQPNSDGYYQAIAAFTDQWLAQARTALGGPAGGFRAFQANQGKEPRSFEETVFELLVLGVLLGEHGVQALEMPAVPAWLLARLIETQDCLPLPAVERPVKAMRALIQGLTQPGEPDETPVDLKPFEAGAAALVSRLVAWLQSADMAAQAERLEEWRAYLATLDEQSAQAILARSLLLAEEFAQDSLETLGAYTQDADAFAGQAQACARWRYDAPLITRSRVEYHLGMLGTEILTRAYRARFLAASRKIVIMPDCLCAHSRRSEGSQECQAARTALGGKCQGCTPTCRVHQITKLGEKRGFEAYILPDDLRGVGLGSCSKLTDVGVVGLSCALTNWDAGWQVNDAGVPCQGVLLDYAGCSSHWDEEGMATNVNIRKLIETLG